MIGIDEWTRYRLSKSDRHKIYLVVGIDLLKTLDRVGQAANSAASGNRKSRREIRRIRLWLGPKYWRALCLMLCGGCITGRTPRIRPTDCRDALLMVVELEAEKVRWGLA
jgi:hypothetical protein